MPIPAASTHGVENAGVLCRQIYFSTSACSFQTLPCPIGKIGAVLMEPDITGRKKKQKSLCRWYQI
jgi:hypothetical protein